MKSLLCLLSLASLASVARADLFVKDFDIKSSGFERTVDLSADGKRVVVAVYDAKTMRAGDAVLFDGSGKLLARWAVQARSVQLIADGRVLAMGDDHLYLLSTDGAKQDLGLARTAVASSDGAWIALLTETHTRDPPQVVVAATDLVQTMAFSSDGTRLLVVTNQSSGDQPGGKTHVAVFARDDKTWKPLTAFDAGDARQADQAMFVGNDQVLVDDQLFDVKTHAVVKTLDNPLAVASADGRALALHDDSGEHPQWAKITGGKLGALQRRPRPKSPAFPANRAVYASAINAAGTIVWCSDTRCTVK
jgi:hypothetical protein